MSHTQPKNEGLKTLVSKLVVLTLLLNSVNTLGNKFVTKQLIQANTLSASAQNTTATQDSTL